VSVSSAKTIYTTETDELLKNPGKGWMTMFKPAIRDGNLPNDIPSTLYYVRINWEQVHIGPDQYNFKPLDSAVADALAGGQQVMIRLMPVWEQGNSPLWMREAGFRGYTCAGKWSADLDDPRVQAHISKLLEEMGKRYNDNPGVHSMEINFLGMYGEGHFYECPNVPMPSHATQAWLVEEHYKCFPDLPIIGPIHAQEPAQYTTTYMYQNYGKSRGAGVFFDGWGDPPHINTKYPAWLRKITGSQDPDIWEKGVMKLEPSGVMNNWGSTNVRNALNWALDYHGSFIGNKNSPIPSENKDDVKNTLKRLGYRLVLRKVEHPESVGVGQNLAVDLDIENLGVAPPYRDYYLAVRLKQGSRIEKLSSTTSVKFWLPGSHTAHLSLPVAASLPQGTYEVAVGVVSPHNNEPAILMPIQGRESSGWHTVSSCFIGNSKAIPSPPTGLKVEASK
jgi:hypothetical protein